MRIDGTFSFNANPEKVWDVLLDPEALRACIPGCQSMTLTSENTYVITLTVGIAQFKGTYDGNVSIQDAQRPDHYEIHVDGKGRPGWVRGVGKIKLVDAGNGTTTVEVEGDATIGGPVFSIGSRFVPPAAKLLMGQFFSAMKTRVERSAS